MTYLRDMMINFQIEKRSFPIYIIPAVYLAFAMLFPDRWNYTAGLGLALILFLGSYGLGKRLSYLVFKISDQTMYFPLGLGLAGINRNEDVTLFAQFFDHRNHALLLFR